MGQGQGAALYGVAKIGLGKVSQIFVFESYQFEFNSNFLKLDLNYQLLK